MTIKKKWSVIALSAAFAMVGALPAVPALAAGHHGSNQHGKSHGHGPQWKDHGKYQNHKGDRQNTHGKRAKNHANPRKNFKKHGPAGKDRLKVMRSMGHVTPPQAAVLSTMTLSQGSASSIFAPKTPYTVYTVRIVGPHAHWSGTGSVSVSDNDGTLTTPADLYYLPFHRGTMGPNPFSGDTAPYNAMTVGASSSFSVSFVRGQAQFAVFNAQAGSGPVAITVKDAALGQSDTVQYPDVSTSTATATATGVQFEYQGAAIPLTGISLSANTPVALTVVNTDASGNPVPVTGSSPLTVNVSTTAPNAEILGQIGGSAISSVQIAPGSSSATIYLQSSVAQTVTPSELVASVAQAAAQNISATETATGATVTWAAPTTGNPASYQVWEINNTTGAKSDVNPSESGSATSYAVTGLSAGDSYSFNVDAVNAYGTVTKGVPSAALEYGTAAVSAQATAFSPNSGSAAGSATFTITMDKSLPSQTPTAGDFTVTDTTGSIDYTVTGVTVSGNVVTVTTTIPAGTIASSADSVTIAASAGALTDSAGAPSAAIQETTTN